MKCSISSGLRYPFIVPIRRSAGFTLLELLIIIGLLAGMVAPRFFDQVGKFNIKIARAQIASLEQALDPWGRPYLYKSPGEHGEAGLSSLGADGQAGGTGENADVDSWMSS